ncbi:uncharacterized protein LOC109718820 [Ananas comosus]|uniref:Uncharacterized protein LOC109718820 n=1 Tax=Ananas comosus TaxID=4615 RepID=A0A6P5G4Y9_ANACO|nr:uncharacterized protein LOC109718820 [Ananas comosus]
MTSRSRRLRNCNIIDSTSQNASQFEEEAREEQSPSSSEPPAESNNTEHENNNQNELFLWIIGADKSRRKKRGRTTLADIWTLSERERIDVEVDKYGVPCTYAGSILGSFLGVVAKNGAFAPLNIPRWDNQAFNPFKEKMLKHVESKFRYPEGTRHWVLASLNKKWRDYKSELRCEYFSEDKSIQELINNVPLGVIRDQWTSLVAHWCTDESKKLCEVNSVSAKKVKMAHTSGRKSYARKRKELEIALGKEPDRLTFWEVTHKKKNGNFVNRDAENTMNTARRKFDELSQNSESDTSKLIDEAFLNAMGPEHNGRVKGLGLGPTLRTYYGVKQINSLATAESSGNQSQEIEKLKEELERVKNTMDEVLNSTVRRMQAEMDRLNTLLSNTQVASGNINPIDAFSPNYRSSNASHEPTSEGNQGTT